MSGVYGCLVFLRLLCGRFIHLGRSVFIPRRFCLRFASCQINDGTALVSIRLLHSFVCLVIYYNKALFLGALFWLCHILFSIYWSMEACAIGIYVFTSTGIYYTVYIHIMKHDTDSP